jgi:xylan 1,4-beta-xylosidase
VPNEPIISEEITIIISDIPSITDVFIKPIDEDHRNSKKIWMEMGSPLHLKPPDVDRLKIVSEVKPEPLDYSFEDHCLTLNLVIPPWGVGLINLKF